VKNHYTQRFDRCLDITDLRERARRRAHRMAFDYIYGGADDEHTLRRSAEAFADYELLFRVLVDVDPVDTSTTVLGQRLACPFFTSPSAGNRLFHAEGARAVARAAGDAGLIYCLSTLSSVYIEEVATLTQGPKWFQCYVWKDRGHYASGARGDVAVHDLSNRRLLLVERPAFGRDHRP
jgi:L-lactate dehydrogenase (cytochrome)